MNRTTFFSDAPDEIIWKILSYLVTEDVVAIRLVSKKLAELGFDDALLCSLIKDYHVNTQANGTCLQKIQILHCYETAKNNPECNNAEGKTRTHLCFNKLQHLLQGFISPTPTDGAWLNPIVAETYFNLSKLSARQKEQTNYLKLLTLESNKGNSQAKFLLSKVLNNAQWLEEAAQEGCCDARYELAQLVKLSFHEKYLEWLKPNVAKNHAKSMYELAVFMLKQLSLKLKCEDDPAQEYSRWWIIDDAHVRSYLFHKLSEEDIKILRNLALQKNSKLANRILIEAYTHGLFEPLEINCEEAYRFINHYNQTLVVVPEIEEILALLEKAALQGHVEALTKFNVLCCKGTEDSRIYFPIDVERFQSVLLKTARRSMHAALCSYFFFMPHAITNKVSEFIPGKQKDVSLAIKWGEHALRLATRCQDNLLEVCVLQLILIYSSGWKVEKDTEKALSLCNQGIEKGSVKCKIKLGRLYLDKGEINKAAEIFESVFSSFPNADTCYKITSEHAFYVNDNFEMNIKDLSQFIKWAVRGVYLGDIGCRYKLSKIVSQKKEDPLASEILKQLKQDDINCMMSPPQSLSPDEANELAKKCYQLFGLEGVDDDFFLSKIGQRFTSGLL